MLPFKTTDYSLIFKELLENPCEIQLVCRLRSAGHSPQKGAIMRVHYFLGIIFQEPETSRRKGKEEVGGSRFSLAITALSSSPAEEK